MTRAASPLAAAAARMPAVSRPGTDGSDATPQARATSIRASVSVTGRPTGSRPGIAPASIAPRSPARRGIHASRAPVAAASRATADSAPGVSASRSPARMIAPGTASASAAAFQVAASAAAADPRPEDRRALPASPPRRPRARASSPGTVASSLPDSLASPRLANGATAYTLSADLRTALRNRRKTMGDSSSGSKPASSTAGACSRSS